MSAPSLIGYLAEGVFILGGVFLLLYRISGIIRDIQRKRAWDSGYNWGKTHPLAAFQMAISAGQETCSKGTHPLPSVLLYAFLEGYHAALHDQQQIIETE